MHAVHPPLLRPLPALQMYCSSLPLYYQLVIDSDEGEADAGDAGALKLGKK